MAHYAFLNENNIVTEVITGVDENTTQIDANGNTIGGSSEAWEEFYGNFRSQTCKRTSYNGNIRKSYAMVGSFYDSEKDIFIQPSPHQSWVLNENSDWVAPIPMPTEGFWFWDEENLSWNEYIPIPNPLVPYPLDGKIYAWSEDSNSWYEV